MFLGKVSHREAQLPPRPARPVAQGQEGGWLRPSVARETEGQAHLLHAGDPMSRRQSRQLVRHGHIQVNGRKVNIPSFQCKVGDEIAVREGSKKLIVLEEAGNFASGQRAVQWLDINRENLSGKVLALPTRADVNLPVNEQLIVELYSK